MKNRSRIEKNLRGGIDSLEDDWIYDDEEDEDSDDDCGCDPSGW